MNRLCDQCSFFFSTSNCSGWTKLISLTTCSVLNLRKTDNFDELFWCAITEAYDWSEDQPKPQILLYFSHLRFHIQHYDLIVIITINNSDVKWTNNKFNLKNAINGKFLWRFFSLHIFSSVNADKMFVQFSQFLLFSFENAITIKLIMYERCR